MKVRNLAAVAVLVAVLSFPVAAHADNRLLPTDVLPPGRGFFQLDYDYSIIEGKMTMGTIEADIKGTGHNINFHLGFGLFDGADVEITCPYVATEIFKFEIESLSMESTEYTEGMNDTTLNLKFLVSEEMRDGANFTFSLIAIFPSGYRKDGQAEVKILGSVVQDQERSYPGEGVFSYGTGFALSGTSGSIEPYMAGSYIFGGRRKRHDIKEHYADEATLQLGLQVHTSPHATLDISFMAIHNSPQTTEEDRSRSREAASWAGGAIVAMYFEFAPDATFMIGITYLLIENHQVDRDSGARIEDANGIIPNIGFHVLF